MTELTPYTPGAAELVVTELVDLDVWASSMANAGHIAKALTGTEFVPKSLRKNDPGATTAAVAAAVLTGKEVGLSPMAALRSIDVIEGTPAIRAVALRALVLRAGHDIWVEESTATRAIICGIRRGSSHEQRSVWTLDRAKTAGLAGKPNWRAHPGAMLIARATAEVCRLIAPDVLLGLPYTSEELSDGDQFDEPAEATSAGAPTPRRTAQRRTRKATAPAIAPAITTPPEPVEDEPPLDEDDGPAAGAQAGAESGEESRFDPGPAPATPAKKRARDPEQEKPSPQVDPDPPAEAMATIAQIKAIERALTKVQITTAQRRIGSVMQITGRPLRALDELYQAEAIVVLDELANLDRRLRERQAEQTSEKQPELSEDDRWDEVLATLDDEQTTP